MKGLIIITNVFYPENNIAAIRLENRIKQLSKDRNVFIITQGEDKEPSYGQKEVIRLFNNNLSEAIYKTSVNEEKENLKYKIKKMKILKPLKKVKRIKEIMKLESWSNKAFVKVEELIEREEIDMVYATVPGIETCIFFKKIAKRYPDIKLVLELRDLITGNNIYKKDSITKYFEEYVEKRTIPHCNKVIFLTSEIEKYYVDKFKLNKYKTITNGARDINLNPINNKEKIIINHVGNFYESRNPINFMIAIKNILNEEEFKYLNDILEINFYGGIQGDLILQINKTIKENNLEGIVFNRGKVDSKEALKIMFNSTINLLITHKSGSEYAIPGKFFEYIGARKKMFIISNDPLIIEFCNKNKLGKRVSHEVENIEEALKDIFRNKESLDEFIDIDLANRESEINKNKTFIEFIDSN